MTAVSLDRGELTRRLRGEDVEEWLSLWRAGQGGDARDHRLELMAAAVPWERTRALRVLDVFSGPGDVGRSISRRFERARVDRVDRDPFLLALGTELDRRRGLKSRAFERDAWLPGWRDGLRPGYDVIAAATALHWLDVSRLGEILRDFFAMLHPAGMLLFCEPVAPAGWLGAALAQHQGREGAPSGAEEAYAEFWTRANAFLGYEHVREVERLPAGRSPIGDEGLPVAHQLEPLRSAGFRRIDILQLSERCVTVAAMACTESAPGASVPGHVPT